MVWKQDMLDGKRKALQHHQLDSHQDHSKEKIKIDYSINYASFMICYANIDSEITYNPH